MSNPFTVNNVTYDLDDLAAGDGGRGYSVLTVPGTGSAAKPLYIAIMEDALADAARVLSTTSATSLTIATGNQVFETATALSFTPGGYITLADTAAPGTNAMTGIVTAASGVNVTINIASTDDIIGSGTKTAWNVLGVGKPGDKGDTGATGPAVDFATVGEVDTGTEAAKAISPDVLSGSEYGLSFFAFSIATPIVEDGTLFFVTPANVAGQIIVDIKAQWNSVIGLGSSTSIQLRNTTQGADVLSTNLTIATASRIDAGDAVINVAEDAITSGDEYQIDIDAIASGTPGTGLLIQVFIRRP